MNLWPWPLSFWLWECFITVLLMTDPHTDFYYPTTIGYWVAGTEYLISFPLSETVTAHAPSPHFWKPWPRFPYTLCHFQGATTKIKPYYRRKIVFSHHESYKVYCACAVSCDLCVGGPPKPHVTIFWPRIDYSLCNFYGATMSIKGTIILEHPHVKAIFGRKKTKSSQNRSTKWRFFGILRVRI